MLSVNPLSCELIYGQLSKIWNIWKHGQVEMGKKLNVLEHLFSSQASRLPCCLFIIASSDLVPWLNASWSLTQACHNDLDMFKHCKSYALPHLNHSERTGLHVWLQQKHVLKMLPAVLPLSLVLCVIIVKGLDVRVGNGFKGISGVFWWGLDLP